MTTFPAALVTVNELILAWLTQILSGTAGLRSVLPKAGLAVTVTGPAVMAVLVGSAGLVGTGRGERDGAADETRVEPGIGLVEACGLVGVDDALDADVDCVATAAGDAPVGPAVELTVTVAGAELFEVVHPDTAIAARTTAAAADVFQAVRLITCIGTVLILVMVQGNLVLFSEAGSGRSGHHLVRRPAACWA